MKKIILCALIPALCAGLGFGQALSRVHGSVTDTLKKPIPDVKITVTMKDQASWVRELTTDAKGFFEIAFTDGTKIYLFQLTKGDYLLLNEDKRVMPSNTREVKPKIFASLEENFVLSSKTELDKMAREEEIKKNPYLKYFEDGRTALLAGKKAEARTQFEACLKEKPEYTKALAILASLDEEDGKHDAAIEKASRVLSMNEKGAGNLVSKEDIPSALKILVRAYVGKKDQAKAQEYQKQLDALEPDSPESLYNKAAELINKKDDAGAKEKLEKALEMKPDFADAMYELGFIHLRAGDSAKCKETFEKFLKLVPTGPKADTVKETLKWL